MPDCCIAPCEQDADAESAAPGTGVEKEHHQLEMVHKQLEKMTKSTWMDELHWSIEDWLASLKVHPNQRSPSSVLTAVADALRANLRLGDSAFEHIKKMSATDVQRLLHNINLNDALARIIQRGVDNLQEQEEGTAKQLSEKFKNDANASELAPPPPRKRSALCSHSPS